MEGNLLCVIKNEVIILSKDCSILVKFVLHKEYFELQFENCPKQWLVFISNNIDYNLFINLFTLAKVISMVNLFIRWFIIV